MQSKTFKVKGEKGKLTITVRDCNALLLIINRTNRQRTGKGGEELNIINQKALIDIHAALHPTTAEYTLTTSVYQDRSFAGHTTNFSKFKWIEITEYVL